MAAITATVLTNAVEGADQSSYATASISPSNNELIIATVKNILSTGSLNTPTCTGNGLTWVQIGHVKYGTAGTPLFAITVFRAMGASPSSGAVTFDFDSQTQDVAVWSVVEYDNVDTGGTNGSGAIVQAVNGTPTDTQTSYSVTLAAFSDVNNATVGLIGDNTTTGIIVGSGFAEQSYDEGLQGQFRNDNDTSVDWTKDSGHAGGVAVEIKNATQASTASGAHGKMGFMF